MGFAPQAFMEPLQVQHNVQLIRNVKWIRQQIAYI